MKQAGTQAFQLFVAIWPYDGIIGDVEGQENKRKE